RRRTLREGRHVPDLLVLARVGARGHRPGATRPGPDGAAPAGRVAAGAVRRGGRHRDGSPPGELPAGVLAPRAPAGGGPPHPVRTDGGDRVTERGAARGADVTSRPPSGEQHEIAGAGYRAVVTEVGATLRSLTHDGVDVVDGFPVEEMA